MQNAPNKTLELEFSHLFEKISLLRTKAYETQLAAQNGREELCDALFKDLQKLLRDTVTSVADIKRWTDEIRELGHKR